MKVENNGENRLPNLRELVREITRRSEIEIKEDLKKLKIEGEQLVIKIDASTFRSDLGYKGSIALMKENTQQSKTDLLTTIGDYARTGDHLMDFQNYDLPQIIKEQTINQQPEIGLQYVRGPEIRVITGELDIDFQEE